MNRTFWNGNTNTVQIYNNKKEMKNVDIKPIKIISMDEAINYLKKLEEYQYEN